MGGATMPQTFRHGAANGCLYCYAVFLRRATPSSPSNPEPNSHTPGGSGTGAVVIVRYGWCCALAGQLVGSDSLLHQLWLCVPP